MKIINAITFLVWVFLGAGCKHLYPVSQKTIEVRDSTTISTTERYVPVYVPGDTVVLEHVIECPEWANEQGIITPVPFIKQVQSNRSRATAEVDKLGRLIAVFSCDAWKDSVQVRDSLIERLQSVFKTESTVQTVPVPFVPKMYIASMWFSLLVIVLLVIYLITRVLLSQIKKS